MVRPGDVHAIACWNIQARASLWYWQARVVRSLPSLYQIWLPANLLGSSCCPETESNCVVLPSHLMGLPVCRAALFVAVVRMAALAALRKFLADLAARVADEDVLYKAKLSQLGSIRYNCQAPRIARDLGLLSPQTSRQDWQRFLTGQQAHASASGAQGTRVVTWFERDAVASPA